MKMLRSITALIAATFTLLHVSAAPPIITGEPTDISVEPGKAALFTVFVVGSQPLTFQWQKNQTDLPGEVSPILAFFSVSAQSAGQYRVVVRNADGTAISRDATLSVQPPPSPPIIASEPQDVTTAPGSPVVFSAIALGPAPITLQWLFNGVVLPGETGPVLSIASATPDRAGRYQLRVSNASGTVFSREAILTLVNPNVPPQITVQPSPANLTVNSGGTIQLSVTAGGTAPLSYQWFRNQVAIAGALSPELRISPATESDAGTYVVVVSNAFGSAASQEVLVFVTPPPVPPREITGPKSATVNPGEEVLFSIEVSGTPPFKYQWYRDGEVIPNETGPVLTRTAVQKSDEGRYGVVVDNIAGTLVSSEATLTVVTPVIPKPTITLPPKALNAAIGANVFFNVTATGPGPLTYQWQRNGVNLEGETRDLLLLANVSADDLGFYRVSVTNPGGTTTSAEVALTIPGLVIRPSLGIVTEGRDIVVDFAVPPDWGRFEIRAARDLTRVTGGTAIYTGDARVLAIGTVIVPQDGLNGGHFFRVHRLLTVEDGSGRP